MKKYDPHTKHPELLVDNNFRCTLQCYACLRQELSRDGKYPSVGRHEITMEEVKKLIKWYKAFSFCGQMSDPIFHTQFIEIIELLYREGIETDIHTAATSKKHDRDWYRRAFEANPHARWVFGIDGLPEESCMHRINQDGEFLFEMMKMCVGICRGVKWQYIVFSYNEKSIYKAKELADEIGVEFEYQLSTRFKRDDDPMIPRDKKFLEYPK